MPAFLDQVSDKAGLRLRSASECSLESELSDCDHSYKASGSDTESDVEMEVGGTTVVLFSSVQNMLRRETILDG